MAFIYNAVSIIFGGLLGGVFKKKVNANNLTNNLTPLSIGIMLIGIMGILENIITVTDGKIVGEHTVVVSIALILGYYIGEALKLNERLNNLTQTAGTAKNGLVESILYFAIGGFQISGPIIYALEGNSFQLVVKSVIDFPFALIFGATYGKRIALSAIAVTVGQLVIGALAFCFGNIISPNLLCQICSLGYLILFFTGFNMICSPQNKIKSINFIPGLLLIIIYNLTLEVFI